MRLFSFFALLLAAVFGLAGPASAQVSINIGNSFGGFGRNVGFSSFGGGFGFGSFNSLAFSRQRIVTPFVQQSFVQSAFVQPVFAQRIVAAPVFATQVFAQPLVQSVAFDSCGVQAFSAVRAVHAVPIVQRQFIQQRAVIVRQRIVGH